MKMDVKQPILWRRLAGVVAVSAALALGLFLFGCSSAPSNGSDSSGSGSDQGNNSSTPDNNTNNNTNNNNNGGGSTSTEPSLTIGDPAQGTAMPIINSSGKTITQITVHGAGSDAIKLMTADQSWADGATASVTLPAATDPAAGVNLELTYSDGGTNTLHNVALDVDSRGINIKIADNVAYLTYIDPMGIISSTLVNEKNLQSN
ncbi:MAG: hypothetical protein FWC59_00870 [Actinomycetia bacterium]|nr:hypothetical protein [Actinomycetes bacterium]